MAEHHFPALANLDFGKTGLLVAAKAVREIDRLAKNQAKDTFVEISIQSKDERPHYLFIRSGIRTLGVRLLDKKYPDYERIIPKRWKMTWSFPREHMMKALHRVSSLSSEKFRMIGFKLNQDEVEMTFENPEVGTGREVVQATLKSGKPDNLPFEINFNARYLLEPMAAMRGETVELNLNEAQTPAELRDPISPESGLWLVMPATP